MPAVKAGTKRKRGLVLVTTLFFMVLFAMLSLAFYQLTPNDNRAAARERTMVEAHFACTAGMRDARSWISAVVAPSIGASGEINYLGDDWGAGGGAVTAGSVSYARVNNDPFSVPDNANQVFRQVTLSSLACPFNKFNGQTGADYLGLKPGANLLDADYAYINSNAPNWLALRSRNPIVVGENQVYTYIVPSANTMQMASGSVANGLRSYLVTTIAYRNSEPVLRARCLLKEQSSADYAYRNNSWATDALGKPLTLRVNSATDSLFDGPVHTNAVPFFEVNGSYWNAAMVAGRKAISGSLTFSGTNTTLTPAFDGVGWKGGNYEGSSDANRPYDNSGNPIASTAGAGIANRYDRFIEGGRSSIRKTTDVALPADLNILRTAAFGADSETGLASASGQVSPNQKNGSVQVTTVTEPVWRDSGGTLRGGAVRTNNSDNGLFINPKSGTATAAGGVVVKGDTRNMFLEVTTSTGDIYTDVTAMEAADETTAPTVGNPTVRVQSTATCYDSNSFDSVQNFKAGAVTVTAPTWQPPTDPPYTDPPPYVPSGPRHSPVGTCPAPVENSGGGGGMGAASYSCPHAKDPIDPPPTDPPPTAGGWVDPPDTQAWDPDGTVQRPKSYLPQDWVTDVTNVDLNITAPPPTGKLYNSTEWQVGTGTRITTGDSNGKQASAMNITEVWVHNGNSEVGTQLTSGSIPVTKSSGKIVLYKQSRSDANRLDVFILDKPTGKATGLNGAVYGTGDISGLRGVNMARKTIGTDYTANKGISVVDNVWQYGTPRGQKPETAFQGLGLVATKMNVQTKQSRFSLTNPLYLYATMIAGKSGNTGGLDVSETDGTNGTNWGRTASSTNNSAANRLIAILGGLTEQQAKARLLGSQGWSQSMTFDRQLSLNPPPFFPATNLLQPMSYSQESVKRGR